jgi:hypothetical protein
MWADRTDAAGNVTPTKDECTTAWAILMPTHPTVHGGYQHPDFKEAIMSVVNWRKHWTVGPYEPVVSQKFELLSCNLKFSEGGTAYVAHCGHGATCNELAREVLKAYPEVGNPVVYCVNEPPVVLDSCSPF